ncbi:MULTISPECIES: hypothetical protein [unclassified Microcoleus]|uniref:hypothetical protein n=1 Tax=unclassified Microcoleus TaxID=2642155 RepID=UPI002FD656E7
MNYRKLIPLIFTALIPIHSAISPSLAQSIATQKQNIAQSETKGNIARQAAVPAYCAPDEYKEFFENFVRGKDRQGTDMRSTYTANRIEVRNYEIPSQLLEVMRRQDDEFSISLRDYRWVILVPSSVDNSPYTRLKIDLRRVSKDRFRVDYIKAQYKYTGNTTGTESEDLVKTYGQPGAYVFQHRNGCWNLTQKLRSTRR